MLHVDRMIGVAALAMSVVGLAACSTPPDSPIETAVFGSSVTPIAAAPHLRHPGVPRSHRRRRHHKPSGASASGAGTA
jgi:hypothetical protein